MATIKRCKMEDYQGTANALIKRLQGYYLSDVYGRCSYQKERAWKYCFEKFANTENAHYFGITSHNTFQFSVEWLGTYEDENGKKYPALFKETACNSYIWIFE